MNKLAAIKTIHTLVWAIMAAACIYVLYAGFMGTSNVLLNVCIALILVEALVLLFNNGTCPLTPMARKYTEDRRHNFDIYLPEWLAQYNKWVFGSIFTLGLLIIWMR